jgi:hypothetical protein
MADELEIRLRLGKETGEKFAAWWNEELSKQKDVPPDVNPQPAVFRPQQRVAGGLGLAIPPEVYLAFAKGVATGVGTGVGAFLWAKLKAFFQQEQSKPAPAKGDILLAGESCEFNPSSMPDTPPALLGGSDAPDPGQQPAAAAPKKDPGASS